jgi:hypothetical protein
LLKPQSTPLFSQKILVRQPLSHVYCPLENIKRVNERFAEQEVHRICLSEENFLNDWINKTEQLFIGNQRGVRPISFVSTENESDGSISWSVKLIQ